MRPRDVVLPIIAAAALVTTCEEGPASRPPDPHRTVTLGMLANPPAGLDLLLVVDDSGSMEEEQARLGQQLPALVDRLVGLPDGMPDLHVGVTSTSLGTAPYPITYCEEPGGDGGRLLRGQCQALAEGWNHVVDVAPTGCTIDRHEGSCTSDCTQAACDATAPGTTLELDDHGCPRCRNYAGATLGEVLGCLVAPGTDGCGFEQPLEAMVLALDDNPSNAGFLRDDAFLAILFLTDEDDCSASNPQLFDSTQSALDSPLGPLTGYRCFEFGITCQPTDDRTVEGPRTDCAPRDDPGALLHPIERYVTFLQGLKDLQLLRVAAIAGPANGNAVTVTKDDYGQPMLEPACVTADGIADPGIRLAKLVEAFNAPEDLAWAYRSVCADAYSPALEGLGRSLKAALAPGCLEWPLAGCADPAAAHGLPGDGRPCNDACRPRCTVEEVTDGGSPSRLPPCLEVCPGGPCAGNADPALAYQGGHPGRRDASLPVAACWHVVHRPDCDASNAGALEVARRADPPAHTFVEARCVVIAGPEQQCDDGLDDDEDCLVDAEDPDCP